MDMLTVGMFGKGHVGLEDPNNKAETACTVQDYTTQFVLWACMGSALILGADVRSMDADIRSLVQNKALLAINQDIECRAPYIVCQEEQCFCFLRHLSDNTQVLVYANLGDEETEIDCIFADLGLPYPSGVRLRLFDLLAQRETGVFSEHYPLEVPAHECCVFKTSFVTD